MNICLSTKENAWLQHSTNHAQKKHKEAVGCRFFMFTCACQNSCANAETEMKNEQKHETKAAMRTKAKQ